MKANLSWGRQCPECDNVVGRWEFMGYTPSLAVEVLEDGSCQDIHTLESLERAATMYACEECGAEVDNASWLKLKCLPRS